MPRQASGPKQALTPRIRLAFTAASSGIGHVVDGTVQLTFRRALATRLGRVPIGWFSQRRNGELAKVVGEDVSAMHPFIAHAPGALISAFIVPVVSLTIRRFLECFADTCNECLRRWNSRLSRNRRLRAGS